MTLRNAVQSTFGEGKLPETWSSEVEVGELLAMIIKLSRMKNVLETGVFRGRTGCYMADALPEDGTYTGIDVDDHRTPEVKEFMEKQVFILGDSREELKKLSEKYYDMVFIDSVHELEFLQTEFPLCEKVLKPNGIIVLHDAYLPGVWAWIEHLRLSQYDVLVFDTCDQWNYNRGIALVKCVEP